MRRLVRVSLALTFVAGLLTVEWSLSRQLEAGACLDGGHVFDWRRGRCDFTARWLPGPTAWYEQLF